MQRLLKKHVYTIAFISWMVFVTFSSLYSFKEDDLSSFNIPYGDKIVHFVFYSVAGALGFMYLRESEKGQDPSRKKALTLLISLIFFGIIIEVVQETLTLVRSGDFLDVLANSAGAICGIFTLTALFRGEKRLK